jgi:hypothetical protein
VHAPREGRAGWVSIGWPGIAGCLTGISEHGVSAAIHDVMAKAVPKSRFTPRPVALQELIESFVPEREPAAEAAAILRRFRYGMGGNFMTGWRGRGDAFGPGGAVFEVWPARDVAAGVTIRVPRDGEAFVTCSNHHRARIDPDEKCWRYEALFEGLRAADGPLDLAAARTMIRRSEVKGTLYQCAIDLGTGDFFLRLRRAPREDRWDEVGSWNAYELLREAAAKARPAKR